MMIRTRRRAMMRAAMVGLVLALGACGRPAEQVGSDDAGLAPSVPVERSDGGAPAVPAQEPAAPAGRNDLPAVTVLDVAGGGPVNLRSLAPAPQPLLVWFWAPH